MKVKPRTRYSKYESVRGFILVIKVVRPQSIRHLYSTYRTDTPGAVKLQHPDHSSTYWCVNKHRKALSWDKLTHRGRLK